VYYLGNTGFYKSSACIWHDAIFFKYFESTVGWIHYVRPIDRDEWLCIKTEC
jgi:hypothetical protein